MNVGNLATILTVTFIVSVVVLFAELLFILRHRRFFPTRVKPSEHPNEKPDGTSPDDDDSVIDVFKLLEANGRSRVLCTIKEDDDREEVESASMSLEILVTKRVCLQTCLESEAAAERPSTPCDSPEFFTPVGSPSV